jgi:hypothetical protein
MIHESHLIINKLSLTEPGLSPKMRREVKQAGGYLGCECLKTYLLEKAARRTCG